MSKKTRPLNSILQIELTLQLNRYIELLDQAVKDKRLLTKNELAIQQYIKVFGRVFVLKAVLALFTEADALQIEAFFSRLKHEPDKLNDKCALLLRNGTLLIRKLISIKENNQADYKFDTIAEAKKLEIKESFAQLFNDNEKVVARHRGFANNIIFISAAIAKPSVAAVSPMPEWEPSTLSPPLPSVVSSNIVSTPITPNPLCARPACDEAAGKSDSNFSAVFSYWQIFLLTVKSFIASKLCMNHAKHGPLKLLEPEGPPKADFLKSSLLWFNSLRPSFCCFASSNDEDPHL